MSCERYLLLSLQIMSFYIYWIENQVLYFSFKLKHKYLLEKRVNPISSFNNAKYYVFYFWAIKSQRNLYSINLNTNI